MGCREVWTLVGKLQSCRSGSPVVRANSSMMVNRNAKIVALEEALLGVPTPLE
jgi:hypothetical protein